MELGEQIELVGFSEEPAELIIIKKVVGNYVKRLMERIEGFERLVLTQKMVHGNQYEIHGKILYAGHEIFAETIDYNLFFTLDACLKKLETQTRK